MTLLVVAGVILAVLVGATMVARKRAAVPSLASDAEIAEAARNGQWMLALKSYRELHGVGLKRSREAVTALVGGGSQGGSSEQ